MLVLADDLHPMASSRELPPLQLEAPESEDVPSVQRDLPIFDGLQWPSRPGEFRPESLTDPDMILSHHPARATA